MFCENLKNHRKRLGMTQEEVANFLMVTPQAVSKWETGNGTPDISLLIPIADLFGISTDELLCRSNIYEGLLLDEQNDSIKESFEIRYKKYTDILKFQPLNQEILIQLLSLSAEWLSSQKECPTEEKKKELISDAKDFANRLQKNSSVLMCLVSHAKLADVYTYSGEYGEAKKEIKELPESSRYTKNRMLGNLELKNKEYLKSQESYRKSIYDTLTFLIWDIERLAQCYGALSQEDFKANRSTMDEIYKIEYNLIHAIGIDGSDFLKIHLCNSAIRLAQRSVWDGNYEKAFEYLDEFIAVSRELQKTNSNDSAVCSIILPQELNKKESLNKNSILFRLSWNAFNPIRKDERFQKYLEEVDTWI